MDILKEFFSNPAVVAIGYVLSLISSCIAIYQANGKRYARREVSSMQSKINVLTQKNEQLQLQITNSNQIHQGEKSQYFQDNNGPVNIDNRS